MQIKITDEYTIATKHDASLIGERRIAFDEDGRRFLADLVIPDGDACLESLCLNAMLSADIEHHPEIINRVKANWTGDGAYYQILDVDINSYKLAVFRNAAANRIKNTAYDLVRAVQNLHKRGVVHAAISPNAIYMDGESCRLGEFWWAHKADGGTLHPALGRFYREELPEFAVPFMAPEVLRGESPGKAADVFALGAVLFWTLTGETPRTSMTAYPQKVAQYQLSETPCRKLQELRGDLDEDLLTMINELLSNDPESRPSLFAIESYLLASLSGPPLENVISISNHFEIEGKRIVEEECKIANATRLGPTAHLSIALTTDKNGSGHWFSVKAIIQKGKDAFLLLQLQPGTYEGNEFIYTAVKIEPGGIIRAIPDKQYASVSSDLINERERELNLELLEGLTGKIAQHSL